MHPKPRAKKRGQQEGNWADELFVLCERRQGKAFISDGIDPSDRAEILRIAEQTLWLQRDLNRDLAKWVRRKQRALHELLKKV